MKTWISRKEQRMPEIINMSEIIKDFFPSFKILIKKGNCLNQK